jgi:hypothetical protein
VVVDRFDVSVRDSMLRVVADRLTSALSRKLAADTSIRYIPNRTAAAKRPVGVTYRVSGGARPRPDGSLRLDWQVTSLATHAVVSRDSGIVRPSGERQWAAAIASEISRAVKTGQAQPR